MRLTREAQRSWRGGGKAFNTENTERTEKGLLVLKDCHQQRIRTPDSIRKDCHHERSEGSALFPTPAKSRSLASLGMTISINRILPVFPVRSVVSVLNASPAPCVQASHKNKNSVPLW